MKICFLLGGFYQNGGIGRVTSVLANCIATEKDIDVMTLGYFNPHKKNIFELSSNIKREYLMDTYQNMTRFMLTGGEKKLRKILIDNNVDVLIACGALFFPIAVRACKRIKTKCICWEHTSPTQNKDYKGQMLCRKYGIHRSDLNVVLTKRALAYYIDKYRASKTVQIYNPIEDSVFNYAKEYDVRSKKIISVGRLSYPKNFETAIDIAGKVLVDHPDWSWDIFGEGELREELERRIKDKGIEDRMHLLGQVDDLYQRYNEYGIMVMTSRYEGFPMSLLEGSGNALPLISFNVDTGPDEIIDDGQNGYLVPAENSSLMIERLEKLIEDDKTRQKMSEASVRKASLFSCDEITKKWKDILHYITL